jgi:hypothetical protein
MHNCFQHLAGRFRLSLLVMVLLLILQGCSDGGNSLGIPPQRWGDAEIDVETRPLQVRPGMVEFLIIATTERGLPAHDMVVSVRMDQVDPWSQTIQDGHSGVYRRAIRVAAGQDVVYVQLRRGKETVVLQYSLQSVMQAPDSA